MSPHLLPASGGTDVLLPRIHMSTHATDDVNQGTTDEEGRRYAELNIGDEEFVIYDRENHDAWIQSTVSLGAGELR